jgi:hypothetical protein
MNLRQEDDRLNVPSILKVAIALIAMLGILVSVAGLWLQRAERAVRPSGAFPERSLFPKPLTGESREVFSAYRRRPPPADEARRELERFGWVDRDAGVAALPIDDAMDLIAQGRRP